MWQMFSVPLNNKYTWQCTIPPNNNTCLDDLNVQNAASLHICFVSDITGVYLMCYVRFYVFFFVFFCQKCNYISVLMFFYSPSVFVLSCHVSLSEGDRILVSPQTFLCCVFFFFQQRCCIHTDLSLEWTSPKLNPTVRLSCVFVKDAMYSSGNSRITIPKANMCPVIPSNDFGGLQSFSHASLPESSHNLSLLLIRTWVSFKPIFLSSEKNDT